MTDPNPPQPPPWQPPPVPWQVPGGPPPGQPYPSQPPPQGPPPPGSPGWQPPPPGWQPPGGPPKRQAWPRRHPVWFAMLTTFAIIIAAIVVVAVAAAPKVPGQQAASTPAASASPAPASVVTDPSGATCTALDGQGYCPGDDPTTPAPTPTGPQQVALGQPITISDTSTNATEGTITVLSAMVTTSPADPSFGSPPANGYYVVVHVSATADQGYTSGMQVNALDFYAKVAGQHFDEGNGNAFQALNSGQQSQDITATLAAGETATGWEAFDVPRPHGYIVYAPNFQGPPLAEWRF